MTYLDYESEIYFTPYRDMDVTGIIPDIWYCNGTCQSTFTIYDDQRGSILATVGWEGTYDQSTAPAVEGTIGETVRLMANTAYIIYGRVSTTKSVGVYTAGGTSPNQRTIGEYTIINIEPNMPDRGPIAFTIEGY